MALYFDSWLVELGAVFLALLSGVYLYSFHTFQYWRRKGILYDEPSFPFGNITDIALQRVSVGAGLKEIYDSYEGHQFVGTYQLLKPTLMIRDPDVIKSVLVNDFACFHARGVYHDENLFTIDGTRWRNLRHKLTPTFTSGKMKMMFPTFAECGNELRAHLFEAAKSKEIIEVKDVLSRYTTDVIESRAFGFENHNLQNPSSEFRNMGKNILASTIMNSIRDLLLVFAPKLVALSRLPLLPSDVSNFFRRVIRETIEYREESHVIATRSASTGEDVEGDQPKTLTMDEVAAQAFVFFAAGFETSATTMAFCLHELAVNQDVQERLREEVNGCTAEYGGQLTYDAIYKMQYLDRVISETLRKYPPLPSLLRTCAKTYQLPDTQTVLDAGTRVVIPVLALHHDPRYYPDPDKFQPDRFTAAAKAKRPQYVYLPFGGGGRNCIGERFGMLQAKVGLASLVSSYHFDVCPKTTSIPLVIDPKSFIMAAQDGIYLQITARNQT